MMSNDSSVTAADILALVSIMVAIGFGAIALNLWSDNQRLTEAAKQPKARVTQIIECN